MGELQIAHVVAEVESRSRPYAMRFERGWLDHVFMAGNPPAPTSALHGAIQSANFCSLDTARMIAATSFGAYQIMGHSIYNRREFGIGGFAFGFAAPIGFFLASDIYQRQCFDACIVAKGINFTPLDIVDEPHKALLFALHYNGSSNVDDYASRLVAEAKRQLAA